MTKFGETHQFKAQDFVKTIEKIIQRPFDGIIYNTRKPGEKILEQYAEQKAEFVTVDESDKWWGNRKLCGADILDLSGGIVRHNSKNLASLIKDILLRDERYPD
jgi:hypothetical protein